MLSMYQVAEIALSLAPLVYVLIITEILRRRVQRLQEFQIQVENENPWNAAIQTIHHYKLENPERGYRVDKFFDAVLQARMRYAAGKEYDPYIVHLVNTTLETLNSFAVGKARGPSVDLLVDATLEALEPGTVTVPLQDG